jgi:drug/metabolite transporter (DMT)-like permease
MLCLAASMSLVGAYVALSKPLVAALPVFLLAWLRFGIGGIAMWAWLRKPADEAPLQARTRWLVFIESLLGNFLFSICMLYGVSMTSAVSAGVILASIPAVVAVLSWLWLGERLSGRVLLAIACAVGGVALLSLTKSALPVADAQRAWLGNTLVMGKRLTASLSAKRISALINLWGFALMTPLGLWAAWGFDFGAVPSGIWLLLVFYGLAASQWTVWLWMTGLRTVPAAQAGVFTVMLPVSAAAVGVLALGEPITAVQALALGVALVGVVLATRR